MSKPQCRRLTNGKYIVRSPAGVEEALQTWLYSRSHNPIHEGVTVKDFEGAPKTYPAVLHIDYRHNSHRPYRVFAVHVKRYARELRELLQDVETDVTELPAWRKKAPVTPNWACPIVATFNSVVAAIDATPALVAVLRGRPLPDKPPRTRTHAEVIERREELAFYSQVLLTVVAWSADTPLPSAVRDFLHWS